MNSETPVPLPLGVVTTMSTLPATCAGVVAVIVVALVTVKLAAGALPKVTAVAPVNCLPAIVTTVPPAVGPLPGLTLETTGGGGGCTSYVNAADAVPVPLGVVTVTSTGPAACAGVVAVIVVRSTTTTLVARTPPNLTSVAPTRFVPVMTTLVPPVVGPLFGDTDVTAGAGTT